MGLRHSLILLLLLMTGACTMKAPVFGLQPEYPENRIGGPYRSDANEIVFIEVASLQPTFRWESFPRSHDLKEDKEGFLSQMKEVSYDLMIWNSENDSPGPIIYARQGLKEPFHRTENPLEWCAKYFWTVRARFISNGKVRVTEWGVSQRGDFEKIPEPYRVLPRRLPIIPNPFLYRFKTPCPKIFTDDR